MKKQKLMAVVLLTALTGIFVGCNDDDAECIADYEGALTAAETSFAGTWTLSAVESSEEIDLTDDEEDNPSKDIYAQQSDCENDMQYIFGADRAYKYNVGKRAEDCEQSGTLTGSWKLGGSTLGLITSCMENVVELEFNPNKTTFSYTTPNIYTKENGERVEIEITFTYSKTATTPTPPEETE